MVAKKSDRLAPPLMYAFRAAHQERDAAVRIDVRENGERVLATRRVTTRAPITEGELRKLVSSDISALMNTVNLESAEDLSDVPEVRRSILNFGLRDLARLSLDEDAVHGVAKELEVALRDFEPRTRAQDDQGPTRRQGVAGRTESAVPGQRRPTAAAGQRAHAVCRGDRIGLWQDQDRPALTDEPRIRQVLRPGTQDPA